MFIIHSDAEYVRRYQVAYEMDEEDGIGNSINERSKRNSHNLEVRALMLEKVFNTFIYQLDGYITAILNSNK